MPTERNRPIEAQLADAEQAADNDPTATPPAVPEPGNGVDIAPPARPPRTVADALKANVGAIKAALPNFPGGEERFVRTVQTAVRMNPELARCEPMSIIGAAMQAAQLGLTPNVLGEAWLIPRRNRDSGQMEATFMVGWKGMMVLADRSGIRITGDVVREGDEFSYARGLDFALTHRPPPLGQPRGKAVAWYAVARDKTTGQVIDFAVLTKADVDKRKAVGQGGPAWRDWPDEMGLKTAAKAVCRFLPLTVEAAIGLASDGAVRTTIAGDPDEYPLHEDAIEIEQGDR